MVAWLQVEAGHFAVYASRYVSGSGWDTPSLIGGAAAESSNLQLAVDSEGNALVAWEQDSGSHLDIHARRFAAGSGWETEALISGAIQDCSAPRLSISATGDGAAIWQQFDGSRWGVRGGRCSAGTGWSASEQIDDGSTDATSPSVALAPSGEIESQLEIVLIAFVRRRIYEIAEESAKREHDDRPKHEYGV